jgi:hypothetical protein
LIFTIGEIPQEMRKFAFSITLYAVVKDLQTATTCRVNADAILFAR